MTQKNNRVDVSICDDSHAAFYVLARFGITCFHTVRVTAAPNLFFLKNLNNFERNSIFVIFVRFFTNREFQGKHLINV